MAGQSRARQEFQAEVEEKRRRSQGDGMWLPQETTLELYPVSHSLVVSGNIQNNRNGLI